MKRKYREREWLREQYCEKDLSIYDIADELGVNPGTIHKWKKRFGLEKEHKYRDKDWLYRKYKKEGLSIYEIADICDVSGSTISRWLREHEIETRGKKSNKGENHWNWQGGGIDVKCSQCGKTFKETKSLVDESENNFCSHSCYSQWLSENQTGENHPKWEGEELTVECAWCGKETRKKRFQIEEFDVHFCSKKCQGKWNSENRRGEKSPAWKGGHSQYNYGGHNWREARKKALERDNHWCQRCGSQENLDVHHIKPFKTFDDFHEANKLDNLVTLCRSCHLEAESGDLQVTE